MPTPAPIAIAPRPPSLTAALLRRPLYVVLSVLIGTIAIGGFWMTYFGALVRGTATASQPLLIHAHAAVFVGWLVLFLTQTVLPPSAGSERIAHWVRQESGTASLLS